MKKGGPSNGKQARERDFLSVLREKSRRGRFEPTTDICVVIEVLPPTTNTCLYMDVSGHDLVSRFIHTKTGISGRRE
jgi:hypothetical protein